MGCSPLILSCTVRVCSSPLAFAHFFVGFFCFLAHMSTRPWCSRNNSLAAMLDPTHLASQPSLMVSSSSVTSVCSYACRRLDSCLAFAARSHPGLFSGFRRIITATRGGFARPRAFNKLLGRRECFVGHNCFSFQCHWVCCQPELPQVLQPCLHLFPHTVP